MSLFLEIESVAEVPASPTPRTPRTSPSSPTSSGDESQATADKMPRHVLPPRPVPVKRPEIDLSAMFNHEQAKQFEVLMCAVMDDMQGQIRDNFDKLTLTQVDPAEGIAPPKAVVLSVPNPRSDKYRCQYGDIGLPLKKPDFDDREALRQMMKSHSVNLVGLPISPTLTIPKTVDEATANSKKSEVELITFSLSEMKRDALSHFGKWRGNVFRRMHDIVIKNGGNGSNVARQVQQQAPGNATRGGSSARARAARPPGPGPSSEASNAQHVQQYPPMYTALRQSPKEKRALILHIMLLMFLGLDQYSSYARIALLKLATALHIPTFVLLQDEYRVSQALAQIVSGISAEEVMQKRAEEGKTGKRWRANGGQAPVTVAFSDILAEPLIAAGVGTVFGGVGLSTSTAAVLLGGLGAVESTVSVGTLFGLYGARQGGKTMEAYAKDIQDFALVPIHGHLQAELLDPKDVSAEHRRMRVTIGVCGWVTKDNDFRYPWKIFGEQNEVYAMRWELEPLMKIGAALRTMTTSKDWSSAKNEIAKRTVFGCLKDSHWPTILIKASKVVDNPWTVAMVRAEKAGLVLAEILNNKVQGERAVTLVGYGLGARVIYACLMSLSEKRSFGVVENAVLIGTPCPSEIHVWAAMKSIVTGRLVNVYSKNDCVLGFMYRTCAWQYGVAGLQPVREVPRVENIDLSKNVDNHLDYHFHVGGILKRLGWEDIDFLQINENQAQLSVVTDDKEVTEQELQPEPHLQSGNVPPRRKLDQKNKPVARQNQAKPKGGPASGHPQAQSMARQGNHKPASKQTRPVKENQRQGTGPRHQARGS
ncbi:DUF726-domain-containing protein [Xylariaceae sp. FL1272]|nr:DUF726-domain-containing protein [Xylariaceae sp. FL1272]